MKLNIAWVKVRVLLKHVYIMVTHWEGHWDRRSRTHYTKGMIKFDRDTYPIPAGKDVKVPTLFVKISKETKKVEGVWEGYTYDFIEEQDKIRFRLEIKNRLSELPKDYGKKYAREGWYVNEAAWSEWYGRLGPSRHSLQDLIIYPPFIYLLLTTKDSDLFEDYTYWLLKLLGIHDVYRFKNQAGHPDGFFVFRDLAVIYDCTLRSNFMIKKEQQIRNYAAILSRGELRYEDMRFNISRRQKQIWIITRGEPRVIMRLDDVLVKEVPVQVLVDLYRRRLVNELNEGDLTKELTSIAE